MGIAVENAGVTWVSVGGRVDSWGIEVEFKFRARPALLLDLLFFLALSSLSLFVVLHLLLYQLQGVVGVASVLHTRSEFRR
jgi:hypothetical protein